MPENHSQIGKWVKVGNIVCLLHGACRWKRRLKSKGLHGKMEGNSYLDITLWRIRHVVVDVYCCSRVSTPSITQTRARLPIMLSSTLWGER